MILIIILPFIYKQSYNRFRYYSPDEGMYISQDPIRLNGGFTLYSYVHDPNGWVDVLGLKKENYDISGNVAATDTPARGVHVNVTGDGLPKKGGHISIVPGTPNKDGSITTVTTAPADKATRDLSDSQFKKASEAVKTYLDDPPMLVDYYRRLTAH